MDPSKPHPKAKVVIKVYDCFPEKRTLPGTHQMTLDQLKKLVGDKPRRRRRPPPRGVNGQQDQA